MQPNADYFKCDQCGTREHINLLDAKPSSGDENNFERFECIACYGPGWCPTAGPEDFSLSIVPRYFWRYRLWQLRDFISELRWRLSRRFA